MHFIFLSLSDCPRYGVFVFSFYGVSLFVFFYRMLWQRKWVELKWIKLISFDRLYYICCRFIYILGKLGFLGFVTVQSYDVCANNKVHYDPMVIFVCLHITLPHYRHYVDLSIQVLNFLNACQVYAVRSVCLKLSQFSQLPFMQYMGLCVFWVV